MFQKCGYRLFHKISIIGTYITFIQQNIKKEAKKWVIQRNTEDVGKLAQKKEELEKEIRENNQYLYL